LESWARLGMDGRGKEGLIAIARWLGLILYETGTGDDAVKVP
jgi:hypothetical protein